jgi:ADP-ribosylglycohydrolase.
MNYLINIFSFGFFVTTMLFTSCKENSSEYSLPETVEISKNTLQEKVKGGWAGQTIGVSFGSHTEFRFNGTYIQDYQPIYWGEGWTKHLMLTWPDLFDDIYMDLTFVDIIERLGIDAPVDSFANAFAYAGYNLWHANQAARYNIMHGIKAPESGHWINNPHADDIDYQIEADFAGLMCPGMPNTASDISDKIGHIMNYGDGWYGGVYVGAMYSLAFISDDVEFIVTEALKTIPEESKFYQCIYDVIQWHQQYPDDWHRTWFEIQRKWSEDVGCPEGVFVPLNIEAKINAAYIVLGLLYGQGDFTKTMEISTRAGQDSDCNPSSAGGILGTMLGYNNIPDYWKMGLKDAEAMDFKYTDMSLNKVYEISFKHALETISRNEGKTEGETVQIKIQVPRKVKLEQCFEGMYPILKEGFHQRDFEEINFEFEGTGFALRGEAGMKRGGLPHYVFDATMSIDGKEVETAKLYTDYRLRRYDLFWKYQLPKGKHTVKIVVNNPHPEYELRTWDYVVYSDSPINVNY